MSQLKQKITIQNALWDILIISRKRPIKAFLEIRIRASERNALRFHWIKNRDSSIIEVDIFTRLVFGLNQSPFIKGILKKHFENYLNEYPEVIERMF